MTAIDCWRPETHSSVLNNWTVAHWSGEEQENWNYFTRCCFFKGVFLDIQCFCYICLLSASFFNVCENTFSEERCSCVNPCLVGLVLSPSRNFPFSSFLKSHTETIQDPPLLFMRLNLSSLCFSLFLQHQRLHAIRQQRDKMVKEGTYTPPACHTGQGDNRPWRPHAACIVHSK